MTHKVQPVPSRSDYVGVTDVVCYDYGEIRTCYLLDQAATSRRSWSGGYQARILGLFFLSSPSFIGMVALGESLRKKNEKTYDALPISDTLAVSVHTDLVASASGTRGGDIEKQQARGRRDSTHQLSSVLRCKGKSEQRKNTEGPAASSGLQ